MSAHAYTILREQAQEDALHAQRLLQVEERPFNRLTRSLLGQDSPIRWTPPKQLPSPPPEGAEVEATGADTEDEMFKRQKFQEDILLDFAAVESSILRIQLIQSSNARERERYAAEKAKILETAQSVKNNTLELRAQLAEAQRLLELRKGYDELAAKLINPRKLKPRAETKEDIERLEKQIEDLQQESADYEGVWMGRREAFDRMVNEGHNMLKVVKGIKDEPEPEHDKDEHMEDGDEGELGTKHERSRLGTPAIEAGGRTPMVEGGTPLPEGAATPRPETDLLESEHVTKHSSLAASPMLQAQEDVDMTEEQQPPVSITTEAGEETEPVETQPQLAVGTEAIADQASTPVDGMEAAGDQEDITQAPMIPEEPLAVSAEEMDES